ncbi:hypothetical protein V1264_008767 [Littorina saxatilis]|uniref:Uncharacterized protein n=1 Tax=Littorina saxatilis TaxID=31220 RepID=A0AAN9AU79_9CAEN
MQSVTDVAFHSSEQQTQHKELSVARQKRDHTDIQLILRYLLDRNPFTVDTALRSISSGKEAEATVNAEQAKGVGNKILSSMIGNNVVDFTFKKKDQAVTMALKAKSSNLHDDLVHVHSMLLFQRLVTTVKNTNGCLEDAFAFEMCSVPASLFDSGGLPRQGTKAALATYIWTSTKQVNGVIPDDVTYVIDGGLLLHLLPWCRGSTYNQLTQSYADFLIRHFGKGTLVFDGYSCGPTTKDAAHLRRTSRANTACAITFEGDMVLCEPKERFLTNPNNKQRFINLLSSRFSQHGFDTVHTTADADRLVVKTSLELARKGNVILVGEDTDLLIHLLYHLTPDHCPVFFTSVRSSTAKSAAKVWDIRKVQTVLGSQVCENILFAHAFGGCDTISSPFGIGKPMFNEIDPVNSVRAAGPCLQRQSLQRHL